MKAIHRGSGATSTERYLARLADRTFLDLWSYPNTYNDNRGHGTGDGKELCDLLVVFGDDVLIFSDKMIEWRENADTAVSWKRWYRRAVEKSVQQIRGAERWLREHPGRVFTDKACLMPLPIDLPSDKRRKYHGIAVALGAEEAGSRFFGARDGSFIIAPAVRGEEHAPRGCGSCQPFYIGDVAPDGSFVHVFDRTGLDLVMSELDTVNDFVRYLGHRAEAIRSEKVIFSATESDLLAFYLQNEDEMGQHSFNVLGAKPSTQYILEGDMYANLQARPEYMARQEANAQYRAWDRLIGQFTRTVLDGTAIPGAPESSSARAIEPALRIMAAEDRNRRRLLSQTLVDALNAAQAKRHARFSRVIIPSSDAPDPQCAYVVVFQPFPADIELEGGYEQYRKVRINILSTYAYAILRRNRNLKRAIGIAMEGPHGATHPSGGSEDLIMLEVDEWTDDLISEVKEAELLYGVMDESRVNRSNVSAQEYPHCSGDIGNVPTRVTRQQRRAAKRRADKARRKKL